MAKKNEGMFGGSGVKDPLADEYGKPAEAEVPASETAAVSVTAPAPAEAAAETSAAAPEFVQAEQEVTGIENDPLGLLKTQNPEAYGGLEKKFPRFAKVSLNWGRHFALVYDNGKIVEYGTGSLPKPETGKPLYYLMESLP